MPGLGGELTRVRPWLGRLRRPRPHPHGTLHSSILARPPHPPRRPSASCLFTPSRPFGNSTSSLSPPLSSSSLSPGRRPTGSTRPRTCFSLSAGACHPCPASPGTTSSATSFCPGCSSSSGRPCTKKSIETRPAGPTVEVGHRSRLWSERDPLSSGLALIRGISPPCPSISQRTCPPTWTCTPQSSLCLEHRRERQTTNPTPTAMRLAAYTTRWRGPAGRWKNCSCLRRGWQRAMKRPPSGPPPHPWPRNASALINSHDAYLLRPGREPRGWESRRTMARWCKTVGDQYEGAPKCLDPY